jgi:uncharacterized protein
MALSGNIRISKPGPRGPGRAAKVLLLALAGGLAGTTGGCERDEPALVPLVAFDTATVRIETARDTFDLRVEVAATEEQRAYGLMERDELPEDRGMIFVYEGLQDPEAGFWMFRTRIPLDIAFMDGDGRIARIRRMVPCESPNPLLCPLYSPGAPYAAALEVNAGFFERRGVEPGDRIVLLHGEAAS